MKKYFLMAIITAIMLFLPSNAFALTNNNNVEMTEEQYNKLVEIYGKLSVDNMSQEIFDMEKNYTYKRLNTKTVYVKTKYKMDSLGRVIDIQQNEITQEEYENSDKLNIQTRANCGLYKECWETNSKKLTIEAFAANPDPNDGGATANLYLLTNTWKVMPKVRSNDIMAFRYYNWQPIPDSAWGQLMYGVNNGGYTVYNFDKNSSGYYAPYGDNIGGFGITMKLPEGNLIFLSNQISIKGNPTNLRVHSVYGTYQHATKNIEEAITKQYIISSDGLGGVIKFRNETFASTYDGMQGVAFGSSDFIG